MDISIKQAIKAGNGYIRRCIYEGIPSYPLNDSFGESIELLRDMYKSK